ncbi:MAG: hypothetical protein J6V25_00270 [Oscillospiraceae bacterium]|nr:hypothetical protein [Oscillospiraceae bacterium]
MKILIQNEAGHSFRLMFPSALLINPFCSQLLGYSMQRKEIPISGSQLSSLFRAASAYNRTHPDWTVVEVQSADGSCVSITL